MQKNKNIFLYMLMMGVWLCASLVSSYAFAASSPAIPSQLPSYLVQNPDGTVNVCPGNDAANPNKGFATRLIPCIRNTIVYTASQLIPPLSSYFADTIKALITLSLVVWGALVAAGNPTSISRDGFILAVKIGFVLMFTNNFANYYPTMLESTESLLALIAKPIVTGDTLWRDANLAPNIGGYNGYVLTIWGVLDFYLELLVGGIFSQASLNAGIVGFIVAAVFSGSIGHFIAIAGLYMLILAIFTIARCMYIFVTSYIAFSFMVLISFMFIPMILFKSTKKYFDGWLQLTISFIIQPIFLMSYLLLFLVAFNSTIFHGKTSLYYAIAGEESQTNPNFRLGEWISGEDGYTTITLNENYTKIDSVQFLEDLSTNGSTSTLQQAVKPTQTAVQDVQAALPEKFKPRLSNTAGGMASFFKSGIEMNSVNWPAIAEAGGHGAWPLSDEDEQKIYIKEYQVTIFLALVMATIFMYLFYSLLACIPYIGNSIAGGAQSMALGSGMLAMPGSNMFAPVRR